MFNPSNYYSNFDTEKLQLPNPFKRICEDIRYFIECYRQGKKEFDESSKLFYSDFRELHQENKNRKNPSRDNASGLEASDIVYTSESRGIGRPTLNPTFNKSTPVFSQVPECKGRAQ